MKGLKKNKSIIIITLIGLIIFGVVAYVLITSNQTIKVCVPSEDLSSGTMITEDLLKEVDVPKDTPGDFIKNKDLIIGYKLKNNVEEGQFLYPTDFLSSWESFNEDYDIPEDYIVTSIQVPDSQACGGLITSGDIIDIYGVSNQASSSGLVEQNANDIAGLDTNGEVCYILSNVRVLNTNSTLSQAQDNDMSEVIEGDSNGSYYIIALSYEDNKKLRIAETSYSLWINIAPSQNETNDPLINQMIGGPFSTLHDSAYPVQDKDGNILADPKSYLEEQQSTQTEEQTNQNETN